MLRVFSICAALMLLQACSPNNVDVDDSLEPFFKNAKVEGTFALFNNATGRFTVYNLPRYRDSAFLPASTFKIVNSLIGLQTGAIVNENMVIKWDSVQRWNNDWNRDLTMLEAFRVSAVNYYQEVARRIGKDTMQIWLDSLQYGTAKIKGAVDSFWLDGSLKISPDEQLGLVKRLYFDGLPFHQVNQASVRKAMLIEQKPEYALSYKTGWGFKENGANLEWMVGWIVENDHPYFFVLNIESPVKDFDMGTVRKKLLKDILAHLGFMQGRK